MEEMAREEDIFMSCFGKCWMDLWVSVHLFPSGFKIPSEWSDHKSTALNTGGNATKTRWGRIWSLILDKNDYKDIGVAIWLTSQQPVNQDKCLRH